MYYLRPAYRQPGYPTVKARLYLSDEEAEVPLPDYPITPEENFRRIAERREPLWTPNSMTDMHILMLPQIGDGDPIGPDFRRKATENYEFKDWFGVPMTWVVSAGGPINTPGTRLLEDVTEWEKVIKFPDLARWDWKGPAERFFKTEYRPGRVVQVVVGMCCTEQLVSVMGGYAEAMLAMATEPEAVRDFFDRVADHVISLVDLFCSLYPVNLMTIHDDWGTEKDTFFSPQMMEQLVFEPTKRILDHIKSKGVYCMIHTCGNITRFVPYMIEMGADFLQIQRRAVDIPALKEKYGDKIGFNVMIEDLQPQDTPEEIIGKVRRTVDLYGAGGGAFVSLIESDPQRLWLEVSELYAYSRQFYDEEREKAKKGVFARR
ncbi:MAG TPA: hypothetical protein GXZ77_06905 [Papillibacter sp.]|jgi:hypothetical protein|nr:hypothetical protein [Papillibacter sp.]